MSDEDALIDPLQTWTAFEHAFSTELRQRLGRILAHASDVRVWAMHASELTDAERAALIEHVTALEDTVRRLEAFDAGGDSAASPPTER